MNHVPRQNGADPSAPHGPRQPARGRSPRPPRAEREQWSDAFGAAVEGTKAIPKNERNRARDELLRAARADGNLKNTDKVVLDQLAADVYWEKGYAEVSNTQIAERTHCSRRGVIYAIKRLEARGWIVRHDRWRQVSRYNDTSLTAIPGLPEVELHRKGARDGARDAPHGARDAPRDGAKFAPQECTGCTGSQSSVPTPEDSPDKSPGAQARATGSDFSNSGDTGPTMPVASARPQAPGAAAVEGKTGSAMVSLPHAYPLTDRPEVDDAIRGHGFDPQYIWDRLLAKHRRKIAKGGDGLNIEDFGRYLIAMAKDEAKKQYAKHRDPDALAAARASMEAHASGPRLLPVQRRQLPPPRR